MKYNPKSYMKPEMQLRNSAITNIQLKPWANAHILNWLLHLGGKREASTKY